MKKTEYGLKMRKQNSRLWEGLHFKINNSNFKKYYTYVQWSDKNGRRMNRWYYQGSNEIYNK